MFAAMQFSVELGHFSLPVVFLTGELYITFTAK